jgi:hypothetical protein
MCGLTVALTIFVTTLCVDAIPVYEASDMKEITEEDMNKPTFCQLDVSNMYISNNIFTVLVW